MATPGGDGPKHADGDVSVLVGRAQQGCRTSFGRLVERYWVMAVGLAVARIHDVVQAEDVAQESFLVAYGRLGELREPSRFAGWLSSIVMTQSINHERRARVRKALPLEDEWAASTPVAERDCGLMDDDQRGRVLGAVARLPAKYQQVVVMRFVVGLSTNDIARQLGKRPGTVRMWLSRAYEKLRPRLRDLAGEVMQS